MGEKIIPVSPVASGIKSRCSSDNVFAVIGLLMTKCSQFLVAANTINLGEYAYFDPSITYGILVNNITRSRFAGNTVTSIYDGAVSPYLGRAIWSYHSMNNLITCNTTEDLPYGFTFSGQNYLNNYSRNYLGSHSTGLQLKFAEIGIQPDRGNVWQGNYQYQGLIEDNNPVTAAFNSRFFANPNQNSPGNIYFCTNLYPPSVNGNWFLPSSNYALPCQQPNPPDDDLIELTPSVLEPIAKGTIAHASYTPIMDWVSQYFLLDALKHNPALLSQSSALDSFYTAQAGGRLLEFWTIQSFIDSSRTMSASMTTDYIAYADQLRLLTDSLISVELALSLSSADSLLLESMRLAILQELATVSQDMESLWADFISDQQSLLQDALILNTSIIPASEIEVSTQDVNDLDLRVLLGGLDTISASDWVMMERYAFACPMTDGPAVFQAQALYSTVQDTIIDDTPACEEPGQQQIILSNLPFDVSVSLEVSPNPTGDGWWIVHPDIPRMKYRLYSGDGRILDSKDMQGLRTWIAADDLHSGMYFIAFYSDGRFISAQSVIVLK